MRGLRDSPLVDKVRQEELRLMSLNVLRPCAICRKPVDIRKPDVCYSPNGAALAHARCIEDLSDRKYEQWHSLEVKRYVCLICAEVRHSVLDLAEHMASEHPPYGAGLSQAGSPT